MTDYWLMDITNPERGYEAKEMLKFKELPPSVGDKLEAIQKRKRMGVLDAAEVLRAMRFVAGVHQSIETRIPGLAFGLRAMITSLSGPLGSALTKVSIIQKDDGRFLVIPKRGKRYQGDYNGVIVEQRFNPQSTLNSYQIVPLLQHRAPESSRYHYPITKEILSGDEVWDGILVECHICGPIHSPIKMERCNVCRMVTCAGHLIHPYADGFCHSMCTKCAHSMEWERKSMYVAKNVKSSRFKEYFIHEVDFRRK